MRVSQEYAGRQQFRGKFGEVIKDLGEGLYQVKFEGAGVVVAGGGRVHTADILSHFLELENSTSAIAPTTEISPPHTSPLHSSPEPAPTTADRSSEATQSDSIDMETEIADMVGMIRTALSSDPQDVEAVVSMVNEIIKAVRNALGISNSTIWERLTAIEQAAYIRALNPQSKPKAEL